MGANTRGLLGGIGNMLGMGGQQNPQNSYSSQNQAMYTGQAPMQQPGAISPTALLGQQHTGLLPTDPSLQTLTPTGPANATPAPGPQQAAGTPQGDPNAPASDTNPNGEIAVTGKVSKPQSITPEAVGMPLFPKTSAANTDDIAAMRQNMLNTQDMARQLYHPGSEFGTHGILRDVVGNVEDFGRRLLGFAPRYNQEKLSEREYGMTSTDPDVAKAATEAAMEYNAPQAASYEQHLNAQKAQLANSQAMSAFRDSQVQQRVSGAISGLGAQLQGETLGLDTSLKADGTPNNPADMAKAEAAYQRVRPLINSYNAKLPDKGEQTPEHFDPQYVRGLTQQGFTGNQVQRQEASVLSAENRIQIQQMRGVNAMDVANLRGGYQVQSAGILANSRMTIAEKEMALRQLIQNQQEDAGAGPYRPVVGHDILGQPQIAFQPGPHQNPAANPNRAAPTFHEGQRGTMHGVRGTIRGGKFVAD